MKKSLGCIATNGDPYLVSRNDNKMIAYGSMDDEFIICYEMEYNSKISIKKNLNNFIEYINGGLNEED